LRNASYEGETVIPGREERIAMNRYTEELTKRGQRGARSFIPGETIATSEKRKVQRAEEIDLHEEKRKPITSKRGDSKVL